MQRIHKILIIFLTVGFSLFANFAEAQCQKNEGNCKCFTSLADIMNGRNLTYDINPYLGSEDARNVFNSGSENIPVTCRAVKYYRDHNPTWFENYFDVQQPGTNVGLFGRENFSPVYSALTAGNVVAVLNHALAKNHPTLVAKASQWLKAYWAVLALGASNQSIQKTQMIWEKPTLLQPTSPRISGFSVTVPGSRAYEHNHEGLFGVLFSMALDAPGRNYPGRLTDSPGFYGGLRAAIESVGYQLNGSGKVNLQSRSVASAQMGLTDQERSVLSQFVQSGGTAYLQSVVQMVGSYMPACDITFIRTTSGLISWFGTSTSAQSTCTGIKGGARFAASFSPSSGTATYLSNTSIENKPEHGSSYRRGNQICADSDALPERCIDIPDGNVVYEVSWKKDAGMVCVGNACQGSPQQPPLPTPPPYNPPQPTPPQPTPAPGGGGSTGSNGLMPDNQPLPGGVANERLIKALYQGILYASPDPAGLAYWRQRVEADGTWFGYKKIALEFALIFEQQHMFTQHSSIQVLDRLWQTFVTSGGCADTSAWFQSTFLSLMNAGDLEEPLRRILNESYFNKPLVQQGPPAQYRVCH